MNRVLVLALCILLTAGISSWGQSELIHVSVHGDGSHTLSSGIATVNASMAGDYIHVDGALSLDSYMSVDAEGNISWSREFTSDGYVYYYQGASGQPGYYVVSAEFGFEATGYLTFSSLESVDFDTMLGTHNVDLIVDASGYFETGYGDVREYGWATSDGTGYPWSVAQDLFYGVYPVSGGWTFDHTGTVSAGGSMEIYISAGFVDESFATHLEIHDYAW